MLKSSFLACAQVYCEVSTRQVLTTEYITGLTIDRCVDLPQTTRNHIAESILKLVFRSAYIQDNTILKRLFILQ
jgi:predicted unusual protein kinase regulating ubiquinone biosynthesis (AarF/ABC1/UbiB family)